MGVFKRHPVESNGTPDKNLMVFQTRELSLSGLRKTRAKRARTFSFSEKAEPAPLPQRDNYARLA